MHSALKRNIYVAFVFENLNPFVAQDLNSLSQYFLVLPTQWKGVKSLGSVFSVILHSDIVFVWWVTGQASAAAFVIAKLLRKKTINVAGAIGQDLKIQRRNPRATFRYILAKMTMRFVDCVVPVSYFTLREVLANSRPKRFRVIYNAIDTDLFTPGPVRRKKMILTVAYIDDPDYLKVKGLDRFATLLGMLPDFQFLVIGNGANDPQVRRLFGEDSCIKQMPRRNLVRYYREATFYCQLSRYESFGVAVAEAMACECVPVVSDSGALPEVVGECGKIVTKGDPRLAAQLIRQTWGKTRRLGRSARKRVVSEFNAVKRSNELRDLILAVTAKV